MEHLFKFIELVGGVLASLITIIVFVKVIVLPFFVKLEIQLTKDLFFRLTSFGEIFFPRVIVHSPIKIQIMDCGFELKGQKKDTQETSYICKAEKFGSVEKNSVGEHSVASFYLPKHSPELLLTKEENKELLIQCNIVGSKEKIKKSVDSLLSAYNELISRQSTIENQQYFIEHNLKKCSTDILSSIKIESGNHTLVCKISYKYKHLFIPIRKKAESKVSINITEDSLDSYRNQRLIDNFLLDYLSSFNPKNSNVRIRYPECNVF